MKLRAKIERTKTSFKATFPSDFPYVANIRESILTRNLGPRRSWKGEMSYWTDKGECVRVWFV